METQRITLDITYDPRHYDPPATWTWDSLELPLLPGQVKVVGYGAPDNANDIILVVGTPVDGFRFFGPTHANDGDLERLTDVELRDQNWWYAELEPIPQVTEGAGPHLAQVIAQKKLGIDCTEGDSAAIKRWFDTHDAEIDAIAVQLVELFPTEWNEWHEEKEKGYR